MSEQAITTPFLNVFAPEFDFDSAEVATAQEQHWYADSPIGRIALRYQEVADLLTDPRFRLGGEAYMALHGIESGPLFDWWMNAMMSVPTQTHRRLRGLLTKAFTPRVVENLRPFTRATAERIADGIAIGAKHDFVAEFADPLPALVMCELVGVPAEDYPQFHSWSGDIGLAFATGGITADVQATVEHAITEMGSYVDSLIAHRRNSPADDLISAIIAAESTYGAITASMVHDLVLLLVWAGQDTTSRQLGRAMVAFGEHPNQWDALRTEPDLIPQAVCELLRWTPQARMIQRFANVDLVFGGVEFSADSVIFCCVAAANRDPRTFPDPTVFNIRRKPSTRHLVFGGGAYHCIGNALAQLELEEALGALSRRFAAPTITGDILWRPPLAMINGPDSLPLAFG